MPEIASCAGAEADPSRKSYRAWWLASIVAVLVIAYPLSFPPMEIIAAKRGWHGLARFNGVIYKPLLQFVNSHPPVSSWYQEYALWWLRVLR